MALYTVVCEDCKTVKEEIVKPSQVSENGNISELICTVCGSTHLKKAFDIEDSNFQLKGSGWFKTGGY